MDYDKLMQKKIEVIKRFEKVDQNIIKLYNAVKIDKLKRKHDLEETQKQVADVTEMVDNLEECYAKVMSYHENERVSLESETAKEAERLKRLEEKYKELVESEKVRADITRQQQHHHLNTQLRDTEYARGQLEAKYRELQAISMNKEGHLRELISMQIAMKRQSEQIQIKEDERKTLNQIEMDNLLKDLETEEEKLRNRNLLKYFNVVPPEEDPHTPQADLEKERERVIAQFDEIIEQVKKPVSPDNKPELSPSLKTQDTQSPKPLAPQYPLTVVFSPDIQFQVSFSLDDTIVSLKAKIFEHINQINSAKTKSTLKNEIKLIDDISIKTKSSFYFANEPKAPLKLIPYFAEQPGDGAVHLVSKRRENLFYTRASFLIDGFIEFGRSEKEEIVYFRNKMMALLDKIVAAQDEIQEGVLEVFATFKERKPTVAASKKLAMIGGSRLSSGEMSLEQQIYVKSSGGGSGEWKSGRVNRESSPDLSTSPLATPPGSPALGKTSRSGSFNSSHTGQQTCTIRIFVTRDIIKTFLCKISTSVGELYDQIFKKFSKVIFNSVAATAGYTGETAVPSPEEMKTRFFLKIRGLEIYLVNPNQLLSSIQYINIKCRRQKKIDLLLLPEVMNGARTTFSNDHYRDLAMSRKHIDALLQRSASQGRGEARTAGYLESNQVSKNFRIKIGGLKNFSPSELLSGQMLNGAIYVVCQIYQYEGTKIGEEMATSKTSVTSNPAWLNWVEGVPYSAIPGNAYIYIQLKINDNLIGWTKHSLWNFRGRANCGYYAPTLNTSLPDSKITLSFEIEFTNIYFHVASPFSEATGEDSSDTEPSDDIDEDEVSVETKALIGDILRQDTFYKMTGPERALIWKYRYYIRDHCNPIALTKLIRSIPWNEPAATTEFYAVLLPGWRKLNAPVDSLQLLNFRYQDRVVRRYAIESLKEMDDQEFELYLPQIIQSLKYEPFHFSSLLVFILGRVLMSNYGAVTSSLSSQFFWLVKSELLYSMQQAQEAWTERYQLALEMFLRTLTPEQLYEVARDYEIYLKLKSLSLGIKSIPQAKRKEFVASSIGNISCLSNEPFALPGNINQAFLGRAFDAANIKLKESKTNPMFLPVLNFDAFGDPFNIILKCGDDLRQDQLTLQMITLMDKLWLEEGVDLQTIVYKTQSTGPQEGIIEVVEDAITIAEIQKLAGGVTAAFSEKSISAWLKQANPSDFEYNQAVDNFIKSCAGCSVYSYILGLGDRHNDNIMITRTGHLFHIDFGRFLGNVQTWKGIKRERSPFVFPASFAHVIGGEENFRLFEQLCCRAYNIIRKHANIFINLFSLMISTGMPELSTEDDLKYLINALNINLTDEQASQKFIEMIKESLKTLSTDLNFAIHILANPN